ncbi:ABC transporter ATP-binding protein [Gordonia sp. PDNC005]|uniref:ABC transporter ATP-binding protein n=1 Tax=unclassified Gordonia (in: high G+C Gram-positive bacteria) TaxID=2657482 RepID=UPI001962DDF9|nr:ABC transporter ATP-binding protein [Gordonia sp. PDNC005]QRY62597.1 ABC transporter ATP-binding protein [Gordonia sp. PDNC005]
MLEISGLDVTVGRTPVLVGVDLQVEPGETVAVVGASGSGKSTLARTVLGLHPAGVRVEARRLRQGDADLPAPGSKTWRTVRGRRIGYVPQDPGSSLNPVRRIGSQVRAALRSSGAADTDREAASRLTEVGLSSEFLKRYPHEVSGGQRQRVLIAMALAGRPGLIVADEPTSALDSDVADQVLDTLTAQVGRTSGLLLVTHDLTVVERRADRVVVLDGGRVVESSTPGVLVSTPSSAAGKALRAAIPGGRRPAPVPEPRKEVLSARSLSKRFGAVAALDAVDLTLHRGETVAVVGPSGSGKSTLARVLVGLTTPDSGAVDTRGRVQLVAQNPFTALDPRWTVRRIIAESLHPSLGLTSDQRADRVRDALDDVGLGRGFADRYPTELSGGQSQRVAIARAVAARPEIVVLDEAVSALDVVSQATVLDILARLQRDHGTAYVFVTHDRTVAADVAHRTVEVRRGVATEVNALLT